MSIQSNINQTISLASLLVSNNESLQAAARKKRESANLAAQEEAVKSAIEATGPDIAAKAPYGEQLTEIKKKQFELNPSAESFNAYKSTRPTKVAEAEASPEEIASEIYESEKSKQEIRSMVDAMHAADRAAIDASKAETERLKRSRDFAKKITEGVPNLSFDPNEYMSPKRKEQ